MSAPIEALLVRWAIPGGTHPPVRALVRAAEGGDPLIVQYLIDGREARRGRSDG